VDVLVFTVSGQRYGLAGVDVRRVVHAVAIAPLPRAPAIVEGIINLQGTFVPVLDIRARFRLPSKPLALTDHFIVAVVGARAVAIRADAAVGLFAVDPSAVTDAALVAPNIEMVAGVAKLPDGLALIHDLRAFLSEAEAKTLDDALGDEMSR
jgi:purine-binding chemotaxis protein CheW